MEMKREWTAAEAKLVGAFSKPSSKDVVLSPQTVSSYENLTRMLTAATGKDVAKSISQASASYKALQSKHPMVSTRKSIVTAVNALISRKPDVASQRATTLWRGYQRTLKQLDTARRNDNRSTPELKKKMIDLEETREKAIELEKAGFVTVKDSMEHLLILMMIDMPPKRADFGALRVRKSRPHDKHDKHGNYVVVPPRGDVTLVLNDYKTSKSHGELSETIPKSVADAMRESLKAFPRDYVFIGRNKLEMSAAAYAEFVKATFKKHTGKVAGVTALRRAYITQTCDNKTMTLSQLEEIAQSMGHTITEQGRYNVVGGGKLAEA
jgi:hypothetical protein